MTLRVEELRKPIRVVSAPQGSHWSQRSIVIGASIGAGSAALAVKHGGADFILVGNVGRLRMMGAPSCSCQLPLRSSNEMVWDFSTNEILTAVDMPVFFGAAACDTEVNDLAGLAQSVRDAGFDGISNYPTAAELTGEYRLALEAAGFGFGREIELLHHAKTVGLSVLGYARQPEEVIRLTEAGVDLICVLFDPELRLSATSSSHDLEVAAGLLRPAIMMARKASPSTLCLCGGAVISNPEIMLHLCELMRADGYIGGSIIDQRPLEHSIEERVAAFKAVSSLHYRNDAIERDERTSVKRFRLVAISDRTRRLYANIARSSRKDCDLIVTGEAGTGKTQLCEFIHQLSSRRSRRSLIIQCEPERASAFESELFGVAAGVDGFQRERLGLLSSLSGCTLILESIEFVSLDLQRKLLRVAETKKARVMGCEKEYPADVRLIFTSRHSLGDLLEGGLILPELNLKLKPFSFELPPLRERLEDLPMLVDQMLASVRRRINPRIMSLEHAALRHLQGQTWAGNLRTLQSTLDQASIQAQGSQIRLADLHTMSIPRYKLETERDLIVDALCRHKFRKTETANFLGISRKTLYNKMKKYSLSVCPGTI